MTQQGPGEYGGGRRKSPDEIEAKVTASSSFVAANGVPLALIGLGAGWLSLTMRRQQRALAAESGPYGYLLRSEYEEARRQPSLRDRARYEELESGVESGYQGEALYGAEPSGSARSLTGEGTEFREGAEGAEHVQRGAVEALRERVSESSRRVSERVRDRRDHLRDRAGELSQEARIRLDHAQDRTRAYAHENPLAIGAVAIAFGFGLGMLLPETSRERRVLGDTSRRLVGEAHKAAERVGRAAKEAASELKNAAAPGPSTPSNPPH